MNFLYHKFFSMGTAMADVGEFSDLFHEAAARSSVDMYWSYSLIVICLAAICLIIGHLTASFRSVLDLYSVQNLFLSVQYRLAEQHDAVFVGYLRSLDLKRASIVSSEPVYKSSPILLSLSYLANFPHNEMNVHCRVNSCRQISQNPRSFYIELTFNPYSKEVGDALSQYLISLKSKK